MSIPSPFEVKDQQREQHLKERMGPQARSKETTAAAGEKNDFLGAQLPVARKKGKAYNLYIDREVMDRVTDLSRARGVSVSSMASALLKIALEQMEG